MKCCEKCGAVIKQTNFDKLKDSFLKNGIYDFIDKLCEKGECPIKKYCQNGAQKCPLMIFNNWLFKEAK